MCTRAGVSPGASGEWAVKQIIRNLTAPQMLWIFGVVCCLAWSAVYIVHHLQRETLVDQNGVVVGKDFMAFYIGGTIVRHGKARQLYDGALQRQTEAEVLAPETREGYSYFINPAPVAVAYSLLTWLPYAAAAHVHTVLMLLAYFAAMRLLADQLGPDSGHWRVAAVVGLLWFPMAHTITGGQNAALTMLLMALLLWSTVRHKSYVAGLALGLLLFKPQYALPIMGLLLLRGQVRTTIVAVVVGILQYVVGALWCGFDWPARMLHTLKYFYRPQERLVSGATHMSLMEVLDHAIIKRLEQSADFDHMILIVRIAGYAIVALIVLYLIWTWRDARIDSPHFALYYALAIAATLVISPHAQYYDSAILILPVVLLLGDAARRGTEVPLQTRLILAGVFLLALPVFFLSQAPWMPFQPFVLLPVGVCIWALRRIHAYR